MTRSNKKKMNDLLFKSKRDFETRKFNSANIGKMNKADKHTGSARVELQQKAGLIFYSECGRWHRYKADFINLPNQRVSCEAIAKSAFAKTTDMPENW
jgi:hypothetical protein